MASMIVRVRLLAILRERAGVEEIELELEQGATVADALERLSGSGPLADLLGRMPVRIAVNRDYAAAETPLQAEDELALIPRARTRAAPAWPTWRGDSVPRSPAAT